MSISQLFPEEGPTLNLNFAGSRTLDPRITFTRTSTGGPVVLVPGEYDEDLNEITPPVIDDAYHVNLRIMDNTEFPVELETYKIAASNPRRIFAGGMNLAT